MKNCIIRPLFICLAFLTLPFHAFGQDEKVEKSPTTQDSTLQKISLPNPAKQFAKYDDSLLLALQKRASRRSFVNKELNLQDVSALLWSAYGINREDGKRTIPTALNAQNMLIYVLDKQGVWLYNAQEHSLEQKSQEDIRGSSASIGQKKISKNAAIALVYVQDTNKGKKESYGYMHAGSMYQNAALYCAMADLGNVVRAYFPDNLASKMGLPKNQKILIIQNIGIKKEQ